MNEMQKDDGNRIALDTFFLCKNSNTNSFLSFLQKENQYWKARVFLELIWEYENSLKEKEKRYLSGN